MKTILRVPEEMMVIALVIVGRHADSISPVLSESQVEAEKKRPERKPLQEFVHRNRYRPEQEKASN